MTKKTSARVIRAHAGTGAHITRFNSQRDVASNMGHVADMAPARQVKGRARAVSSGTKALEKMGIRTGFAL